MLEKWFEANEAAIIFAAGAVFGLVIGALAIWLCPSSRGCECLQGKHSIDCKKTGI